MAFPALMAREGLRPWLNLGLRHCLRQPVSAVAETRLSAAPVAEDTGASPSETPASSASPSAITPRLAAQWEQMLERIQSGAGYVITYWELGLDMGGAPEAARRAFWRDLLARLAMPKGTLAFWPLNILDAESGALLPSPGHFQAGAERLGAETVLCFGRRCADVLGLPPDLDPYASCQSAGRACLLLPELNDLLGGGDPLETLVHALSRLVRR